MPWANRDGKRVWIDDDVGDAFTNPWFSVEVHAGHLEHWMSFDPKYGPEHEAQIEWHVQHGTPGAETWEVGKPL